MDSNVGGFHEVEKDGKLVLVYHHPKYCPIPQIQTVTSSTDHPLFLCPRIRRTKNVSYHPSSPTFRITSSPEYVLSTTTTSDDHHVLPLFWCNNKEFDATCGCFICEGSNFGTDYYFCNYCSIKLHKECIQSPLKIKHPYHPEHYLQLFFHDDNFRKIECLCCGRKAHWLIYHCTTCQAFMHPICAMKPIPFLIDPPKKHIHPLTFFPRQTSLTCNVCGLLRKNYPTYVCFRCNFVTHNDCMNFPHIIKISRHRHRISFTFSLTSREWFCGVCRLSINVDYGAYTCDTCSDYVVHSICALGKDVWDGKELEGIPEIIDITQDDGPFEVISEGVILYFHHNHNLRLEVSNVYDENLLCQACAIPIYEGNLYVCMECDFILHETCAKAPRRIHHALHPHPLILEVVNSFTYNTFRCNACDRGSIGFAYECRICNFKLDVRCALISEPFDYKGHEDPLFLALNQEIKPICHICKTECLKQLNCIKCNFIVCFKCVTLPYKIKYKHDTHFLTISFGEEVREQEWCEICERSLKDTCTEVFYWCNECCTTFHIECLIGGDPYIKPGQYFVKWGCRVNVLPKCNTSRPVCPSCKNRCIGKIYDIGYRIACSFECL
ncbi:DC1 [Arabidopsis suecica]|uniref:DC1 n=1 Tax=Arabidopsis suecica TaxID=45249 RepID=A0A8T2G9V7_ARASU|nr:DC1 [Arabidopsis suecica]